MWKGRILVLVCLLALSALPATAQEDPPGQRLAFDEPNSSSAISAQAIEPSFQIQTVLSGLQLPTVVRFSPDGRIFVGGEGRSRQGSSTP